MSLSKPDASSASINSTPASSSSSSSSPIAELWQSYLGQLVKNPVRTKAITSATTAVIATVIAQMSIGVPLSKINWTAVKHQALLGLIRGPTIHYWMELLNNFFNYLGYKGPTAQSATPVVVGKMALDQLVFAPLHLMWYIHAVGFLEGRTFGESQLKVSNELWGLMKNNWRLWPLVSVLNFKFVPPQLRVLTLNVVGIFWMVIIIRSLAAAAAAGAAIKKA